MKKVHDVGPTQKPGAHKRGENSTDTCSAGLGPTLRDQKLPTRPVHPLRESVPCECQLVIHASITELMVFFHVTTEPSFLPSRAIRPTSPTHRNLKIRSRQSTSKTLFLSLPPLLCPWSEVLVAQHILFCSDVHSIRTEDIFALEELSFNETRREKDSHLRRCASLVDSVSKLHLVESATYIRRGHMFCSSARKKGVYTFTALCVESPISHHLVSFCQRV